LAGRGTGGRNFAQLEYALALQQGEAMIRDCSTADHETMLAVVNDAARAYRGVIPEDRLHDPYMSIDQLRREIADGVAFSAAERGGILVGVMGIQPVDDVTLIRHAYVRTDYQSRGIGGELLGHLLAQTQAPVLIGTWTAARWAIRFYEKHGFEVIDGLEKDRLLRRYWSIPQRQIETSVVLADSRWRAGG
jgi:N-acetylglutamate synthase-like GNAT family acetyltransferase